MQLTMREAIKLAIADEMRADPSRDASRRVDDRQGSEKLI